MIWLGVLALACAPRRLPEPARTELSVLTWNLYFGAHDQPGVEEVLADVDPEVVFLQETNAAWQARLEGLFPYQQWVPGPQAGGGVALLSKYPIEPLAIHEVPGARFPAQRAVINTPSGPIEVLNLHLIPPFGPRGSLITGFFRTKQPRYREVKALLELGVPDLACGDLNASEREASVSLFEKAGMVSALPEYAPGQHTWHGPGEHDFHWRIDHCMVGPALQTTSAQILEVGPADHYPLWVGLRGG